MLKISCTGTLLWKRLVHSIDVKVYTLTRIVPSALLKSFTYFNSLAGALLLNHVPFRPLL